jgi:hypothetical protein
LGAVGAEPKTENLLGIRLTKRAYAGADLVKNADDQKFARQFLFGLVQKVVQSEPGTWDSLVAARAAKIEYHEPSEALVVQHTESGHEKVAELLNGLRKLVNIKSAPKP